MYPQVYPERRCRSHFCLYAEAAKDVVLAEKPTISGARDEVDSALLREVGAGSGAQGWEQ